MARFDTDKNGGIDHNDTVFPKLAVWADKNSDGISTTDEVSNLVNVGILSIDVSAQSYQKTVNGNLIKNVSYATLTEANKVLIGDVNLRAGVWDKLETNTTTTATRN